MINGKNVIAVIPARGGSKGIKDKNIIDLGGKPLIAWAILVAKATSGIDRIIVSTDSEKISEVARDYGAEVYMRPDDLATDSALVIDALRHLRDTLIAQGQRPDVFVLLEPTAPFRVPADIQNCAARVANGELDSIATFANAHTNPHRTWVVKDGLPQPFIPGAVAWVPRQQLPEAYELTGSIYAFNPLDLPDDTISIMYGRFGAHIVPENRANDIDTIDDLRLANVIFESSVLTAFK